MIRHQGRIIAVPPSTSGTIVFPYRQRLNKFDTSHYNPIMTNNRVSAEEIDKFLEAVLEPIEEHRKKQFLVKYPWAIVVLIILLPLFYIFMIYLLCTSGSRTKQWEEVKDKSRAIIKEKGAAFEQRGMVWIAPLHFPLWIELWTQPAQTQNGYGMMPMNQQMGMQNNMMPNQYNQANNQQMQYGAGMYGGNNNMNA